MKLLLIGLIHLYRLAVSPVLPPSCRFYPTCSQYFIEALHKKGMLLGTAMGLWRLLRCHPFCRGGYDPAEKKELVP